MLKLPEVIERIEKFYPLMNKLTNYTGKIINTPRDMVELYHTFMAESAMGLTLLPWAYEIFPNGLLHDGAGLWHKISSYNNKLKRLTGGENFLFFYFNDKTNYCQSTLINILIILRYAT